MKAKIIDTVLTLLFACAVISYFVSAYKLFTFDHWTGMELARLIGLFMPPLGAILGVF
ncbi:hypothetical protein [Marinobacter similis]|uniref:Uncharacterized protein n=1 Tax=Marinobacter similis TaxID=1420916 RepID=W5YMG0_9GAMM|nr:hypothetical protein [Marinobacter similis]AHI30296.1 hypothetical protein AU14_17675 [Marinobacter similis]